MDDVDMLIKVLSKYTDVENVYDETVTIKVDGVYIKYDFDDNGELCNIRVL